MFDIGMPEFLIIALVALVVIGPERLPQVMGKIGRLYRQMREMSDQLVSEARSQWEEGMREVESVSETVSSTWQDAITETTPPAPPPRLQQVASILAPASTAAAAGPWVLPATNRDTSADVEPFNAAYPHSPSALPRRSTSPYDAALDVSGDATLMGPVPVDDDAIDIAYDLPPLVEPAIGSLGIPAGAASGGTAKPPLHVVSNGADQDASPAPPPVAVSTNGEASRRALGSPEADALGGDIATGADHEHVIVERYRRGTITLDHAAAALRVDPNEFLEWVRLAELTESRT